MNLFEIAQQYRADVARLEEMEVDEQTFADTLEALSGDFDGKVVNVIKFSKNLEATADSIQTAIDAMTTRKKSLMRRSEALRSYVFRNMLTTGISKISCDHFALSIRDNPPSVDIFDLAQLPQDYMREIPATYAPDKTLIKTAIKDGFVVPGAKLVTSQRLEIK